MFVSRIAGSQLATAIVLNINTEHGCRYW